MVTTFYNVATMVVMVVAPDRKRNICFRFFTVSYLVNSYAQVCIGSATAYTHTRTRTKREDISIRTTPTQRESRQLPYAVRQHNNTRANTLTYYSVCPL